MKVSGQYDLTVNFFLGIKVVSDYACIYSTIYVYI